MKEKQNRSAEDFCSEKKSKPCYVVGMGEVLWDMLPEGKQIGGAPANFAFHVSQFGLDGRVISAVGNDQLGNEIREIFAVRRLQGVIEEVAYPTGTVQVTVDAEGVPGYEIRENVAWDYIPYTPVLSALARQTCAVCWGSLAQRNEVSRDTLIRFLDEMPDDGCMKIFDVNLRQQFYTLQVLEDSIKRCNVLKINDDELEVVGHLLGYTNENQCEKCLHLIYQYSIKMLILTCGVKGSYIFTPTEQSFIETPKVKVADTVGAGDSFTAALIASLLKGKSIREAHECAVQISAYVCTQSGAMPLLPYELLI